MKDSRTNIQKPIATMNKKVKTQEEFIVKPIHPGEILRKGLLIPQDISPQELAQAIKVPKEQIKWICEERADITPDLAARLSLYFDTSVELWLNLQRSYEEEVAERQTQLLKKEIIPRKAKPIKPIVHASTR